MSRVSPADILNSGWLWSQNYSSQAWARLSFFSIWLLSVTPDLTIAITMAVIDVASQKVLELALPATSSPRPQRQSAVNILYDIGSHDILNSLGYADEHSFAASAGASHIVEHRSLSSTIPVQNPKGTSVFLSFSTPDEHKTHLSDNNELAVERVNGSASQATPSHDLRSMLVYVIQYLSTNFDLQLQQNLLPRHWKIQSQVDYRRVLRVQWI